MKVRLTLDNQNKNCQDIVALLRACANQKDLHKGSRLHAEFVTPDLIEGDCYLASTLVNMYVKCGALKQAAQVLQELPVRTVVTWNALVTGYAQCGHLDQALDCLKKMDFDGIPPNAITFTCILKACGQLGASDKVCHIHELIVRQGLFGKEIALGNTLMDVYAKCGALAKAALVLDALPLRNVFSWTALIARYAELGRSEEALRHFEGMQQEGISPNAVTFTCILKVCSSKREFNKVKQIHNEIMRWGLLENDVILGTTLVDVYAKLGEHPKASQVLDELPVRDVTSWNALITGFTQEGYSEEVLECFEHMRCEGLSPSAVTFICVLKACGILGALHNGKQIHNVISADSILRADTPLGNALVDMYAKCAALASARQVLDELPVRDVVTWTTLISGYVEHGQDEEALDCFDWMQQEGHPPNAVTFAAILKACASKGVVEQAEEVHDDIIRQGLLGKDVALGTSLVDMYAKLGALEKAAQLLDELSVQDVASWNALLKGYAERGEGKEAQNFFDQMLLKGLSPDAITYVCMLEIYGSMRSVGRGEEIHIEIARKGLLREDPILASALVDMYVKLGALAKAEQVLDHAWSQDVVSWTTLITGYAENGQGEKALRCFEQMQHDGHSPNTITFLSILKACGSVGATQKAKQIYIELIRSGMVGTDIILGTTMVDMYARFGSLKQATQLLDNLPLRDAASWNALIAGYAQQAQGEEALSCLKHMQYEGLVPNMMSLSSILSACSRSGLWDEAETQFVNMKIDFGITPDVEHHTCMVDLFSRAGELDKAMALIQRIPCANHLPVWHALLSACGKCGNVHLGELAFINALKTDQNDAAAYVLLAKIYAGRHEDAKLIDLMRMK